MSPRTGVVGGYFITRTSTGLCRVTTPSTGYLRRVVIGIYDTRAEALRAIDRAKKERALTKRSGQRGPRAPEVVWFDDEKPQDNLPRGVLSTRYLAPKGAGPCGAGGSRVVKPRDAL